MGEKVIRLSLASGPVTLADVYIVHSEGNLVTIKTNRGAYPLGFASKEDGERFLRSKNTPASLGTIEEILQLRRAHSNVARIEATIFYLPSREAIEQFAQDPTNFPTGNFLTKVTCLEKIPPLSPLKDETQNEFKF
jgi:hypothetical protein